MYLAIFVALTCVVLITLPLLALMLVMYAVIFVAILI